jgi:hypothetical protein
MKVKFDNGIGERSPGATRGVTQRVQSTLENVVVGHYRGIPRRRRI